MISRPLLLTDLQRLLKKLEADLRARSESEPAIKVRLTDQYAAARAARRTAAAYTIWRDDLVTQIGVAWILGCVFVRFLEDNDLLDHPFLSGPGERLRVAGQQREDYFRAHPVHSDRDYLEHVFRTVRNLPTLDALFGDHRNPLWQFGPSGDAATDLLRFWQTVEPDTGALRHDFTDPRLFSPSSVSGAGESGSEAAAPATTAAPRVRPSDLTPPSNFEPRPSPSALRPSDFPSDATRFLGDLYQDLSEAARKQYALLQTPRFVEEFILDRTLTPAIETFGLAVVRMIDPTCGSGHFLLGGFERLLERWRQREPGTPVRELVQRALDAVHGVDLNPFAVAIARFRLLIAALRACDIRRLRHAPAFRIHVASGDSLLHGRRFREFEDPAAYQPTFDSEEAFRDELKHHYEVEDTEILHRILGQQYHAVVGNPPYITVKDRALSELYRLRYPSCRGKYSLSVPFMERFFDLAVKGDGTPQHPAGFTGQITANSFMKREFGKKLIEQFIPRWDLTHVIDTDKAHIPDHATGTVILLGKHQPPCASTIRAVMGIKKQEPTPELPEAGSVWLAIRGQVDIPGSQSEWISVADSPRESFHRHPWSIGGGGAAELKDELEGAVAHVLGKLVDQLRGKPNIGITAFTLEDDMFVHPPLVLQRIGIGRGNRRVMVEGDTIRDWLLGENDSAIWPYREHFEPIRNDPTQPALRFLWLARTCLTNNLMFGQQRKVEAGLAWYEFGRLTAHKFKTPLSITFGEIATHNHFVLDRGGKVFKQTAPVIKLKPEATEADHFRLLGILNSSAACFWLRQVCHDKGGGGIGGGIASEPWEHRFAFNGTQVANLPVPACRPSGLSAALVAAATELQGQSPASVLARELNGAVSGRASELPDRLLECSGPLPLSPIPSTETTSSTTTREIARGPGHSRTLRATLDQARARWNAIRQRMIALQEELDWQVYEAYELVTPADRVSLPEDAGERTRPRVPCSAPSPNTSGSQDAFHAGASGNTCEATCDPPELPEDGVNLGERAFEIVMARKMAAGELQTTWFERHGSTPITELPALWPAAYRELVEHRIAHIESDPNIRLIEQPEYKRRWNTEPWDEQLERALRQWLLTRLEQYFHGGERMTPGTTGCAGSADDQAQVAGVESNRVIRDIRGSFIGGRQPALVSTHQLADCARADADFLRVAEVYRGRVDFDLDALVAGLVADESVPFLPVQRYRESGLRKRAVWEQVWELQRMEDHVDAETTRLNREIDQHLTDLLRRERPELVKAVSVAQEELEKAELAFHQRHHPGQPYPAEHPYWAMEAIPTDQLAEVLQLQGLAKARREVQHAVALARDELARKNERVDALRRQLNALSKPGVLVPPKYASADFRKANWWRLRGKLDVPKERWISFPGIEQDPTGGLVIVWAGWDHLQQARALSTWYEELRGGGAPDAKLLLVLAGLQQLVPWLLQWHNDLDAEFGVRMGDYFRDYVADETRRLGKTEADLRGVAYGG
jgi:hypothetical protein